MWIDLRNSFAVHKENVRNHASKILYGNLYRIPEGNESDGEESDSEEDAVIAVVEQREGGIEVISMRGPRELIQMPQFNNTEQESEDEEEDEEMGAFVLTSEQAAFINGGVFETLSEELDFPSFHE